MKCYIIFSKLHICHKTIRQGSARQDVYLGHKLNFLKFLSQNLWFSFLGILIVHNIVNERNLHVSIFSNQSVLFVQCFIQSGLLALPMAFLAILLRKLPTRSKSSSRISKRLQKETPSQRERQPPNALNKLPSPIA